jgi:hypothetical protein
MLFNWMPLKRSHLATKVKFSRGLKLQISVVRIELEELRRIAEEKKLLESQVSIL